MSEANIIRFALTEVLQKCSAELSNYTESGSESLQNGPEEYLKSAQAALERLRTAETEEECNTIAREVLSAVALFRTSLGLQETSTSTTSTDAPPDPEASISTDPPPDLQASSST